MKWIKKTYLQSIPLRFGVCLSFYWFFWLYCVTAVTPFIERICYVNYITPFPRNVSLGRLCKYSNNCRVAKPLYSKRQTKRTTSVMMSKESKINEGLALLNEKNNYQNSGSLSYLLDTSLVSVLLVEWVDLQMQIFAPWKPAEQAFFIENSEVFFPSLPSHSPILNPSTSLLKPFFLTRPNSLVVWTSKMAGQRHSWKQFMDRALKYACFAGYSVGPSHPDIIGLPTGVGLWIFVSV